MPMRIHEPGGESACDAARAPRDELTEARARARMLAELAVQALDDRLDVLLDEAVAAIAQAVCAECCGILKLSPDGASLELHHGTGWCEHSIGAARVPAGPGSWAALALEAREPLLVEDLQADPRFDAPQPLAGIGVRGALSVAVAGAREPAGLLAVFRRDRTAFVAHDVEFVSSVATIVSHGIRRHQAKERIRFQADLLDMVGQAIIATDLDGQITFWNRTAEALYGWRADEVLGRSIVDVTVPVEAEPVAARIMERVRRGESWSGEFDVQRRDGSTFPASVTDSPITDAAGALVGMVGISADVTERRSLEEQLRQAQRLEAVGRLAGGVAHDFNNLLTVIKGNTQFVLEDLPPAHPVRDGMEEVGRAADRATALTRQLLAFSRRQVLQPTVVDVGRAVVDMEKMLRRLIGEDVALETVLDAEAGSVLVDPGQLEQVIMNLVINARDAMPDGGHLTLVTTSERVVGGHRVCAVGEPIAAGDYVVLSVVDTGVGIGDDVRRHIFEPFFTTKDSGKGTGLGLSMVYGIVKQSGGAIELRSAPGAGTTFRILLPRMAEPSLAAAAAPRAAAAVESLPRLNVLVVEDDGAVRSLVRKLLQRLGHHVLDAADGAHAMDEVAEHDGAVDVLITDVILPGMSGPELARRVAALHPAVRVIFMSGYTDDALLRHGVLRDGAVLLTKPLTPVALAARLAEAWHRAARPTHAAAHANGR